jgi:hypothetical protein
MFSNAYLSRVSMSWFWWGMVGVFFAIQADPEREPALNAVKQ